MREGCVIRVLVGGGSAGGCEAVAVGGCGAMEGWRVARWCKVVIYISKNVAGGGEREGREEEGMVQREG